MSASTQLRGNCQVCGRIHAVLPTGLVAKHGYTVKDGWFQGICSGQHSAPMQKDTATTAKVVADILKECEELEIAAQEYKAGTRHPACIKSRNRGASDTPWSEAPEFARRDTLNALAWSCQSRASHGRSYAAQLSALAAEKFGQPLIEAAREAAPEPIAYGEVRLGEKDIKLVCTSVMGPRVYWKSERNGKTFKGWTGTAAWRRLTKV